MADIFISYRRESSAGEAGRLFDRLERVFGRAHVFMDVDNIEPGDDFVSYLDETVSSCDVLLAFIGPKWLDALDHSGRPKLEDPNDFVRVEIRSALEKNKRVIPVLLQRAEMPRADQLPEDLRPLVRCQAAPLTHNSFNADAEKLIQSIGAKTPDFALPEPEMVRLPADTFLMGSPPGEGLDDERPQHEVRIGRAFAIGKYPVTFDEYDAFAKSAYRDLPRDEGWGRGRRPVIRVSWKDAVAYAQWLSVKTSKNYRLPTEAEWEYAARAGTSTPRFFRVNEDDLGEYAWHDKNSERKTQPVGGKRPNPWGLYDVYGNVGEWTQDCWHDSYGGLIRRAPTDGSAWLEKGGGDCNRRVLRGGSWYDLPEALRSAFRYWNNANFRNFFLGFRLAQDL